MRFRSLASLALLAAGCAAVKEAPAAAPALDVEALGARCARGFAQDCRALGRAHLLGDGVPRDDRLAASLLLQACELGDPAACGDLGVLHALGRGVAQSDAEASALSRRACEQGSAIACSNQGALLAEGAGRLELAPDQGDDAAPRIARLFRTSCEAGVPEGCLDLGTVLEAARGVPRDARAAGAAYRRACEAGLLVACHRLALLLGDRPDAAPDLTAAALEERACRAAIAPACAAANAPTPARGSRTPAARLVDDRASLALGIPGAGGFHAAELAEVPVAPRRTLEDVRRPGAAVQAAVPAALREPLGLGGPARSGAGADPAVDGLVALRRGQLGQCYEAPRAAGGARVEAWAAFLVGADGRAVDVRAATAPADAELEACVRDVVAAWEFPTTPGGYAGPFAAGYAFEPGPAGPAPQVAPAGGLRPALRDPACVQRALRVPDDLRGAAGAVTVKLAVDAGGSPRLVHALTPLPEPMLAAVADAVRRCEWTPGADASGHPEPFWATLTVSLQ